MRITILVVMLFVAAGMVFGQVAVASGRSPVDPAMDKIIHLSVLLATTPDQAFRYFTDKKLLESWLTTVAEVEPKTGGKFELFWEPSDRENNSTVGCRITAIADGQLLAFEWRSPKQFKPFANAADPLTHVVVSFAAEGASTRVHLVHSGWRSTKEWQDARLWQERAWNAAFDKLEQVAKKSPPSASAGAGVTGLGGVFFKAKDPKALKAWYAQHLGIVLDPYGGASFVWRANDDVNHVGKTAWAVFAANTTYLGPKSFMLNYRVADLDRLLAELRKAGVTVDEKVEKYDYGKFGWAIDPEGNRIELWEPTGG